LKNNILAMMAVLVPALTAAAQANPDVIWKGDFETGASSLTGSCGAGQDQWCHEESVRAAQIQAVTDPVIQGKYAARFEVKYGDVYNNYSDSRALMSGPTTLWEDEGNDRWYRWQSLWPLDYVGTYPKWDQLSDPSARSNGGWIVEWHQDPINGIPTSGSAPLYIGANDTDIMMCIVNQATSECGESISLAKLIRGHWHDIVLHAKWSSSPSVGFLDMWVDGVHVLPMHRGANMYSGMRNYLLVGLYRNGEIGDPNLTYANGTHVYGTDGTPGVVYLDGFIVGKTQASVLGEALLTSAATTPTPDGGTTTAPDAGTTAGADPGDAGTGAAAGSSAASPNVTAASAGGGGCASGGLPLAWVSLIGFAALMLKARRQRVVARR
jgi:hypothetical protein